MSHYLLATCKTFPWNFLHWDENKSWKVLGLQCSGTVWHFNNLVHLLTKIKQMQSPRIEWPYIPITSVIGYLNCPKECLVDVIRPGMISCCCNLISRRLPNVYYSKFLTHTMKHRDCCVGIYYPHSFSWHVLSISLHSDSEKHTGLRKWPVQPIRTKHTELFGQSIWMKFLVHTLD